MLTRTISKLRLQSAMEYLMTYGWAILIISVVLGTLFQLGIFSSGSLAPKAPPGSCRVFRAAGTTNLEGTCSSQLPKYVAQFGGVNSGSYADVGSNSVQLSKINQAITVSAWAYVSSSAFSSPYNYVFSNSRDCCGTYNGFNLAINTGTASLTLWNVYAYSAGAAIQPNAWYYLAGTYDGSKILLYVNGVQVATTSYSGGIGIPSSFDNIIGGLSNAPATLDFGGYISNIQIYNTSLDAGEVQSMYAEGIGGTPQALQNLVGWWPLNGDVNDYSGKNNNGVPTAITYTAQYGK